MGGKTRPPYPAEYRARIMELARAGRSPEELAKEFEPTGQTIRNWLRQDDRDGGRRQDGLTSIDGRNWSSCVVNAADSVKSGKSLQKQRPGSLVRPT